MLDTLEWLSVRVVLDGGGSYWLVCPIVHTSVFNEFMQIEIYLGVFIWKLAMIQRRFYPNRQLVIIV